MRKSLMMIGVVALALSWGLVQATPAATDATPLESGFELSAPLDARFELAKLTATNLDPNSGYCRKMLYGCTRGDQAACANYERHCEP